MNLKSFRLILILGLNISTGQAKLALVQVPVADLISDQVYQFTKTQLPTDYYLNIALSPFRPGKDIASCPRQHQALLHEIVDIIKETKHEACVTIFNAYYLDQKTKQKTGTFWTLKKNLVPLNDLAHHSQTVPLPINYHYPNRLQADVITLTKPWTCPQTGLTYSAGTRFKIDPLDSLAYLYEPQTKNFIKIEIPQQFWIKNIQRTPKQLRQLFVKLVQNWARPQNQNFIPYTWGGCSVVQRVPVHQFEVIKLDQLNYYAVPPFTPQTQTGLDCSGLVLRATQAVGLPIFYKNTSTLVHELKPLAPQEPILPGDLLWLSGHIIIITDPKTGWCVEARDYGHGYGKVQRIHISKLFKDVQNLAQIKAAHHQGTLLTRIDRNEVIKGKYQIKLLKLI